MSATMEVDVEISDPWELTRSDGPTIVRGTTDTSLDTRGDELILAPFSQTYLAGKLVALVVLRARHAGSSFTEMDSRDGLSVNGRVHIYGSDEQLRFIGVARRVAPGA